MSDELLVMALLEEGNPATDLGDDVWSKVPAATYLATLERRSSEMTQLETKKNKPEARRLWTTPWLVAAIAVIVLGVAAIVVSQMPNDSTPAGAPTIPLEGADGDPLAAKEFEAVEAAYHLFNIGDPAWLEVRVKGSFFESQEEEDATLEMMLGYWTDDQVRNPYLTVSECVSQGHGQWPDLVDPGVPAPTGYYFVCQATYSDALYDLAGVNEPETYHWVVDDGVVLTVTSDLDIGETEAFLHLFESWLMATYPDILPELTPFSETEDLPRLLEYAEEFIAQSDKYPIDASGS